MAARRRKIWLEGFIVCAFAVAACVSVSAQPEKPIVSSLRTITINTVPAATVWIDGVRYGKTDDAGKLTTKMAAHGRHVLRIRADGYKEIIKTLLADNKSSVDVNLVKTNDPAELAFQQAERLTSIDRDRAAEAYKKAIALWPRYLDAYIGLARVYSEARKPDESDKAIKAGRKIDPRSAELSTIEGRNLKDGGNEIKAIASFKRAITECKGFQPEAFTALGLIYNDRAQNAGGIGDFAAETANYDQAAKYFEAAIKQLAGAPDTATVYQFLGLIYEQQHKPGKAIAVYQEFLDLFPASPEAETIASFIVQQKKLLQRPQ